jgi:hypothetical protein
MATGSSGHTSRRTGALAARSPASHRCIAHPVSLGAATAVLAKQGLTGHTTQPYGGAPGTGGYAFQCMLTQVRKTPSWPRSRANSSLL